MRTVECWSAGKLEPRPPSQRQGIHRQQWYPIPCPLPSPSSPEVAHVGGDDGQQDGAKAAVEAGQALRGRDRSPRTTGEAAERWRVAAAPPDAGPGACLLPTACHAATSSAHSTAACAQPNGHTAGTRRPPQPQRTSRAAILANASAVPRYTMLAPPEPCTCSRALTVSGGSAGVQLDGTARRRWPAGSQQAAAAGQSSGGGGSGSTHAHVNVRLTTAEAPPAIVACQGGAAASPIAACEGRKAEPLPSSRALSSWRSLQTLCRS